MAPTTETRIGPTTNRETAEEEFCVFIYWLGPVWRLADQLGEEAPGWRRSAREERGARAQRGNNESIPTQKLTRRHWHPRYSYRRTMAKAGCRTDRRIFLGVEARPSDADIASRRMPARRPAKASRRRPGMSPGELMVRGTPPNSQCSDIPANRLQIKDNSLSRIHRRNDRQKDSSRGRQKPIALWCQTKLPKHASLRETKSFDRCSCATDSCNSPFFTSSLHILCVFLRTHLANNINKLVRLVARCQPQLNSITHAVSMLAPRTSIDGASSV